MGIYMEKILQEVMTHLWLSWGGIMLDEGSTCIERDKMVIMAKENIL
jgi:hypothetical protein